MTNLLTNNTDPNNAAWAKSHVTVNATPILSPDGTIDAEELIEDTVATSTHRFRQTVTKAASSLAYSMGCYVERGSGTRNLMFRALDSTATNAAEVGFDLGTGTINVASTTIGTGFTAGTASITSAGGSYWLVKLENLISNTDTSILFDFFFLNGTTQQYTGDGASSLRITQMWGNAGTTLDALPVGSTPFAQSDWPNPTLDPWKTSRAYLGHTWGQRLALTVPNTQPQRQVDWPNPTLRGQWGAQAYLGFTSPNRLALTVPNKMPFRQLDWPNPVQPPSIAARQDFQDPLNIPLNFPPKPFAQDDWPNPRAPAQVNLGFTARSITAVTAPSNPFAQTDWLNPRVVSSPAYLGFVKSQQLANSPFAPSPDPYYTNDRTILIPGVGLLLTSGARQYVIPGSDCYFEELTPDVTLAVRKYNVAPYVWVPQTPITLTNVPPPPLRQNDWPNPIIPQAANRGFIASSGQALTFVAPPFSQHDWPNPIAPWSSAARQGFISPLNLALNVPNVEPFTQDDWPNPILPWKQPAYQGQALGQNLALNVPNIEPFAQLDWPNPIRPWNAAAYQGQALELNLALNVGAPFTQDDWPNPIQPVSRAYQGFTSNRTTTAPPFAQSDWPNPLRAPIPGQGFVSSALTLATFVQPPFVQDDWPNPMLRPFSSAYLGFTSANRLALTVPNVEPFGQSDWPNPLLRLPPIHPVSASNIALPSAVVFVPHNQADWPNPILPVARAYQGQLSSGLALTVPNKQPFAQADWPNPRGTLSPAYQWVTAASNVLATPLAPFSQDDWPNPRVQTSPAYQGFTSNSTTLIGPNFPGNQDDWPNPIIPVPPNRGFVTGSVPATSTPFNQDDWPNPVVPVVPNRGFVTSAMPTPTPFNQDDWPNPVIPPTPNRGFVTSGIPANPVPFNQDDWPNPILLAVPNRGFVTNRVPAIPVPFNQDNWPNPVLRPFAGIITPPNNGRPLYANLLLPVPFRQLDWPNYRSLRSPIYDLPLHHYNSTALDVPADRTYYSHLGVIPASASAVEAGLARLPGLPSPLAVARFLPSAVQGVQAAGVVHLPPLPLITTVLGTALGQLLDPLVLAASLRPFRKA